jgi:hypothetical protein
MSGRLGDGSEHHTARVLAHQVLSIHPMVLRMVEV